MFGRSFGSMLGMALVLLCGITARADERNFWKHSGGHFKKADGDKWIGLWQNRNYDWVEKARTAAYVEIFDSTRDFTIRLYAEHCDLKRGRGAFQKHYVGKWQTEVATKPGTDPGKAPTGKPDERVYWKHANGYIKTSVGKTWEDVNKGTKRTLVELRRTDDYIELKVTMGLDYGKLHLTADKAVMVWARGRTLNDVIYTGGWAKEEVATVPGDPKGKPGTGKTDPYTWWRYGDGHFEKSEGNTWIQFHRKDKYTWTEKKRNNDYVELRRDFGASFTIISLDPRRCRTIIDKGKRKPGIRYEGRWGREDDPVKAYVATGKPEDRDYWYYGVGHFEKVGEGRWIEKTKDATHNYVEQKVTGSFIEILDIERKLMLRLGRSNCSKVEGGPTSRKYRPIHEGSWGKPKTVVTRPPIPGGGVNAPRDIKPWDEIAAIQGPSGVSAPVLSPDGAEIALTVLGEKQKLSIIDVATFKEVRSIELPRITARLAWSADGSVIAGAMHGDMPKGISSRIIVWDAKTLKETASFDIPGIPGDVAISAKGTVVVGMSTPSALKAWNVSTNKELISLDTSSFTEMALSASGRVLAASNLSKASGKIVVIDVATRKVKLSFQSSSAENKLSLSADGAMLVDNWYAADGMHIHAYNLARRTGPMVIKGGLWKPNTIKVIDQGKHVAIGGGMGNDEVRIYDLKTGALAREWVSFKTKDGARSWTHLEHNADSSILLTYGTDKMMRLWATPYGEKKEWAKLGKGGRAQWVETVANMRIPADLVVGRLGGRDFNPDKITYNLSRGFLSFAKEGKPGDKPDQLLEVDLRAGRGFRKGRPPENLTFQKDMNARRVRDALSVWTFARSAPGTGELHPIAHGRCSYLIELQGVRENKVIGRIYICLADVNKGYLAGTFEAEMVK